MPWDLPEFIIRAECDACGRTNEFTYDDRDETNAPDDHGWSRWMSPDDWMAVVESVPAEERAEPMKAVDRFAAALEEGMGVVLCPDCLEKMPEGWEDRFEALSDARWEAKLAEE